MSKVLMTGATGFVGSCLVPALVDVGCTVRAMTRRVEEYAGPAEPVHGDVSEPGSLSTALAGCDAVYYLVHSLGSEDFEQRDARAAHALGAAAGEAGVRQVVYLGGLGRDDDELSAHLRSRRDVEFEPMGYDDAARAALAERARARRTGGAG